LDLTFRVLGIPVHVGPSIIIGLALLGLLSRLSGPLLIGWIALGLAALLLHELGHALVFRRFGLRSRITFFLFGGLTVPDDAAAAGSLSDARMVAVALAGPGVSLAVGLVSLAAVFVASGTGMTVNRDGRMLVLLWLFVNIGWAVFNLLPIGNLDGGRALRHLLGALIPGRAGIIVGTSTNLVASALVAFVALLNGLPYVAFIAVIFGLAAPNLWSGLTDAISPPKGPPEHRDPESPSELDHGPGDGEPRGPHDTPRGPYESIYRGEPPFRP
jgi:stage IV sporulation protein FB